MHRYQSNIFSYITTGVIDLTFIHHTFVAVVRSKLGKKYQVLHYFLVVQELFSHWQNNSISFLKAADCWTFRRTKTINLTLHFIWIKKTLAYWLPIVCFQTWYTWALKQVSILHVKSKRMRKLYCAPNMACLLDRRSFGNVCHAIKNMQSPQIII